MSTIMFKCPSCGGYLEFDAKLQKFKCRYCDQEFAEDALREQSARREAEAEARAEQDGKGEQSASASMKGYHCQMCGAEIVTEATTAATRCYFCHSPVVLQDRLDDAFRPDGVIPFKIDKEIAQKTFMAYIRRKLFVDKAFFDDAQLEMLSGVYYPYWYYDVWGETSFAGEGIRRTTTTTASYYVTTTRYYKVEREARMTFRNLARKALKKLDGKLSDGIHPYQPDEVKPYAAGFLSGFLAETRDVEADAVWPDVLRETEKYADSMIRRNHTYQSLRGDSTFRPEIVEKRYVLLPVWVLTWKGGKDGAPYYYLMNGQTGKVCGKLPINWPKLLGAAAALGAVVAGLLTLGGALLW